VKLSRKVEEAVCVKCHSGFHGKKTFDFKRDYSRIRCDAP
jgi:hypothetical protein